MSKYRFKTKEEFIRDGLWRENCPYGWNSGGNMNKYLGQDIPEELNDNCDKGVGFTYEDWYFSSNDYVSKETSIDMKDIQEEAKKRFPIGCKFKNTNGYICTLKKDDIVYEIHGTNIWAHHDCGCLYDDGKWAELISLPESVSMDEFKEGEYIVLIGKGQSISDSESIQSSVYKQNHCYKVRENDTYLITELDSRGNIANGWKCIPYNPNKFHKTRNWRYATPEEIAEYDKIGKPYDVTTLQKKEIFPENGYVVITNNPINLINYLKNNGRISASDNSYTKEKTIIAWNNVSYWFCSVGSSKPKYSEDFIEKIIEQPIYTNSLLEAKKESMPEYVECVRRYGDAKIGTIYKTSNEEEAYKLFGLTWKQVLIQGLHLGNQFKPSTKEAYEAQFFSKGLTKKDLVEGEIYFYDNDHIAVYPEGPSFSIKSKIYDSNIKWNWILKITHATEEQKALLRNEIEKYSSKTTSFEEYTPLVGDYVVMEKAGGWGYSPVNNGCIAIVKKVSSKIIQHLGSVSYTVPSINGTVVNPKSLNNINFIDIPIMGYSKERIFRKALPHEIPSNLPKKDVVKKSDSPLEICRQKYKKGMVVISAKDSGMYSGEFTINVDPEEFTITGGDEVDYFRSEGFLYYEGKYAEILSYPDEHAKIENSKWSSDSIVEERINTPSIKKETFIENVQSVNVMLRTKKKSIKF